MIVVLGATVTDATDPRGGGAGAFFLPAAVTSGHTQKHNYRPPLYELVKTSLVNSQTNNRLRGAAIPVSEPLLDKRCLNDAPLSFSCGVLPAIVCRLIAATFDVLP